MQAGLAFTAQPFAFMLGFSPRRSPTRLRLHFMYEHFMRRQVEYQRITHRHCTGPGYCNLEEVRAYWACLNLGRHRLGQLLACTLLAQLTLWATPSQGAESSGAFQAASTLEEVQRRQRLLPSDDIWWTATGEQMAWMHKNVHQLFPTVNVYRAGQVRELQSEPIPAIRSTLTEIGGETIQLIF